jgi:hypothetical protein
VLYPAALRDMLLRAAENGLYQPRWSALILEEVRRNLIEDGGLDEARAWRPIAQMRERAFSRCRDGGAAGSCGGDDQPCQGSSRPRRRCCCSCRGDRDPQPTRLPETCGEAVGDRDSSSRRFPEPAVRRGKGVDLADSLRPSRISHRSSDDGHRRDRKACSSVPVVRQSSRRGCCLARNTADRAVIGSGEVAAVDEPAACVLGGNRRQARGDQRDVRELDGKRKGTGRREVVHSPMPARCRALADA